MKFCSVLFIQACKDFGHYLNECYRDPNVKTNFEYGEELDRLKSITKNKKKAAQSRDEVLFEENKNRVKIDTENLKNMRTKQIRKTYKETSEFIIPKVEILKEL